MKLPGYGYRAPTGYGYRGEEKYGLPAACWSAAHLLVDMGCALMLTGVLGKRLSAAELAEAVLLYDMLAFVLQLPFGFFLDMADRNVCGAVCAAGCFLVAAADFITLFFGDGASVWLVLFLAGFAGLGNACFHIGAGTDVLRIAGEEASLLGGFVSTGALGLYLGSRAGRYGEVLLALAGALLLLLSALLFILWKERTFRIRQKSVSFSLSLGSALAAAGLFTLVIMYRSYLGFMMKYSWRSGFLIGLFSTVCVMAGKITGGIAGDLFGWGKTVGISLGLSAVLALFSEDSAICGILALFLFNMTMPITMTGLALAMPEFKGSAFGINTTALFIGFIWAYYAKEAVTGRQMSLQILVSLAIFLLGFFIMERGKRRRRGRRGW